MEIRFIHPKLIRSQICHKGYCLYCGYCEMGRCKVINLNPISVLNLIRFISFNYRFLRGIFSCYYRPVQIFYLILLVDCMNRYWLLLLFILALSVINLFQRPERSIFGTCLYTIRVMQFHGKCDSTHKTLNALLLFYSLHIFSHT